MNVFSFSSVEITLVVLLATPPLTFGTVLFFKKSFFRLSSGKFIDRISNTVYMTVK